MKRKMKRTAAGILAAIMVLSGGTIQTFAANTGNGRNFIDANSDGICDNYTGKSGRRFVDEDGDGICDNYVGKSEKGCRFTDEDGDGLCDNCGMKQKNGQNKGKRSGYGRNCKNRVKVGCGVNKR